MRELDFDGIEQPALSPRLLEKVADTFSRKLGRHCSASDAEMWWDFIWPDFELYWKRKGYRAVSRAVLGWAARIREVELDQAIEAKQIGENIALEKEQKVINEDLDAQVTKIDYFSRLGGGKQ